MALHTFRVPKLVEIRNPWLLILFYLLQVGCVCLLIAWFITEKFWESHDEIGRFIHGSIDVQRSGDAPAVEKRLAERGASTCRRLEGYEYWRDAEGRQRWQNMSCLAPCKRGQTEGCVGLAESFMVKSEGEVFIPTHRKVIPTGRDWHDEEGQESVLLSAEALTLVLSYRYDMPQIAWDGQPRLGRGDSDTASSMESITTTLVDANGKRRSVAPGKEIAFTVPQLLESAGGEGVLNDLHAAAGTNQHPDSAGEPPLTWLSGLELEVSIECSGNSGEVLDCSLRVHQTKRGWTYERTVDRDSRTGEQEVRVYHGIRVFMNGRGRRRHFDLATLVSKLTSSWVLLLLPRKLVFFISITILGHLSTIYRQATIDTFRLKEYMAGMSARLLVWNAAFVELQDSTLPSGHLAISKSRLHERLRAVLSDRGNVLDEGELQNLVNFCYKAVALYGGGPSTTPLIAELRDISNEVRKLNTSTPDVLGMFIDSGRFSGACTSNEHINLDAVVRMFDKDRRRWFLERVFTPNVLRKYILDIQRVDCPPLDDEDSSLSKPVNGLEVDASGGDAQKESADANGQDASNESSGTPDGEVLEEAVRKDRKCLSLEQEMEAQRKLSGKVLHMIREYKRLHERCEAHSRQLEENHLALQRTEREWTAAVRELRRDVEAWYVSTRTEVQAASQKLDATLGKHGESLDELRHFVDDKHASLEGRHDMLQELHGAVDAIQRSIAQRLEHVEVLLDLGARQPFGPGGGPGTALGAAPVPRGAGAAGRAPPPPPRRFSRTLRPASKALATWTVSDVSAPRHGADRTQL